MQISLIRHGKSEHTTNKWINSKDFGLWVQEYDRKGILTELEVPVETLHVCKEADIIFTSHLARTIKSVHLADSSFVGTQDLIFREAELPTLTFVPSFVKLRPNAWAFLCRLLWLFGYSNEAESMLEAKKRAQQAAERLIQTAQTHEKVVLVGHGFFNMFIAKELL